MNSHRSVALLQAPTLGAAVRLGEFYPIIQWEKWKMIVTGFVREANSCSFIIL